MRARWSANGIALALLFVAVPIGCGADDDAATSNENGSGEHTAHAAAMAPEPGARRIEVDARSYAFEPERLEVRAGEDVALALTARDTLHDLVIEGMQHVVAAGPGATQVGGLRVDEPGTYAMYCSVTGHRKAGMTATLLVSPGDGRSGHGSTP
jgi:plastocyanin